LQQLAGLIYT
jgi:hypothetical protein